VVEKKGRRYPSSGSVSDSQAEEAEHGRSGMVLAVAPAEAGAGEEGEPALACKGGSHEARRLVRREAEEDLL
jgi:hypothetical protein